MYTRSLIICFFTLCSLIPSFGQKRGGHVDEDKYRRSSLHIILAESGSFPKKDIVIKAYNNAPFPEKYNKHIVGNRSFNPKAYPISNAERLAFGINKNNFDNDKDTIGSERAKDMPLIIKKHFEKEKTANLMVAKWFNRQEDGSFDMSLISERGFYDASEIEANLAKGTVRGIATLADAGEELIKNTFVIVNDLTFLNNEIAAHAAKEAAIEAANELSSPILQVAAIKAAEIAYEKAKEGYTVVTTSYLYQLDWNDSVAAVFYSDLWMDKNHLDNSKKIAFDTTNLFRLKYVGSEIAKSAVLFSSQEANTEEEIIALATIRNVDNVYAKLQKKYDVFKTKTPLYSSDPLAAKIGMKEGLEGGERFQVLEQVWDDKAQRTKYVNKGTIFVDKKNIWDNRYSLALNNQNEDESNETGNKNNLNKEINATKYKGKGNYYQGMLIRQIK